MKFRNQRMILKESFSKQLQKAHAEAQQLAAQETEEDDAVIEVSPKRKQSNSNWKTVYFKQLHSIILIITIIASSKLSLIFRRISMG